MTHQKLQDVLQQATESGSLACPDVVLAADMLLSMLTGFERSRLLLGVALPTDGTDAKVRAIVEAFMRAFAPNKKGE